MKDLIRHRKKFFLLGILLFFLEAGLLIWPAGLAADDTVNFLAGENMWLERLPEEGQKLFQAFNPQFPQVKSIGFFLSAEEEVPEGSVSLSVTDADNVPIFEKELSYSDIDFNNYTDVAMHLTLEKGESYFLVLEFHASSDPDQPLIGVCPAGQQLKENGVLSYGRESTRMQLLTRYHYTDTIPLKKAAGILLLCLVTAAGLCFGLPRHRRIRKSVQILLFFTAPLILGRGLEFLSANPDFLSVKAMFCNVGIMYLMELNLLLWTGSIRYAVILTNSFLTVLYTASHFVYLFRGSALRLNDLAAIRTAANVLGEYSLHPDASTALVWAVLLCFIVYSFAAGEPVREKKDETQTFPRSGVSLRLFSAAMGILLFCGSGYLFLYTDFLEKCGFDPLLGINQQFAYQVNGYLVSTCFDIQNSRIEKPEGYSPERAEEILQAAIEQALDAETAEPAAEDLPHVILIMNESFTDLRILGNLLLSQENMAAFYELQEDTIRGHVNVSGLGGGTANSEFEVFTGCSMGLLPASYYPYQQCFTRPLPSLVSHMEDAGYTTYSMHPADRQNYNRVTAYDLLGFDHSFWAEDFEGAEQIHIGVSDRSTYHKIEEIYENRAEGERLFIFDMTIQNHGDYKESDVEQTVSALNVPYDEVTNFLSLIRESDTAFGELVHYFKQQEEKVIICMFGDHQPKFPDESFYDNIYAQTPELTDTDILMNQYKTPFIIWANYDIPEQENVEISTNYLGVLLERTAGISLSPYFAFLERLEAEFPIVTVNGRIDADGNYHYPGEGLEEYLILQYRYLFDPQDITWGY